MKWFRKLKIFFSGIKIKQFHSGSTTVFEAGKSVLISMCLFNSITIRASSKNDGIVFIGSLMADPAACIPIDPGDAISVDAGENHYIEKLYANTDKSGAIVHFFGIGD